jgi:hypothetical protein
VRPSRLPRNPYGYGRRITRDVDWPTRLAVSEPPQELSRKTLSPQMWRQLFMLGRGFPLASAGAEIPGQSVYREVTFHPAKDRRGHYCDQASHREASRDDVMICEHPDDRREDQPRSGDEQDSWTVTLGKGMAFARVACSTR